MVARGLAIALALIALAALTATIWLGLAGGAVDKKTAGFNGWWELLWLASWVGFPVVGGAVATRRPESRIAWLMLAVGVSISTGLLNGNWLIHDHAAGRTPAGAAVWLGTWLYIPGFVAVPFIVDRFPGDRPATGRWRWVVRAGAAGAAAVVLASMVRPSVIDGDVEPPMDLANPLAAFGALPETVLSVGAFVVLAYSLAVVVRLVVRYRRSRGVERAQLRWFAAATSTFPILFAIMLLSSGHVPEIVEDALVALAFFIALNGIAIAIGIAVTRYRLYDLDRVVSRTVAYALLTGAMVGVYALGVLGVGALLPGEPSDLLVAGSTLTVAALFQPMRRRIQRVVDRRFNRSRYVAAELTDEFGRRLRDRVDLDVVAGELGAAVSRSLEPATASVWLARPQVTP